MKALSLWQPWASLIADKRKPWETRGWEISYRGPLAIHAAKKVIREACIEFGYDPKTIPTGAVLCTATLADCVQFPSPMAVPDPYGDFTPGRYGFLLKDIEVLAKPIPAIGHQGLWNFDGLEPTKQTKLIA